VRYINLFPPGGATDILSRLFCAKMSELSGQQFVVENRVGAAGTVGQAAIAKAPPDGSTLGLGSVASLAIAPSLYPALPYDPARDFAPIVRISEQPFLLLVNAALPARSVAELVALAKARPGALNYASFGTGTSTHLMGELLRVTTGAEVTHVPYRGSAPGIADLIAGQVQFSFDTIPAGLPHVAGGRRRAGGADHRRGGLRPTHRRHLVGAGCARRHAGARATPHRRRRRRGHARRLGGHLARARHRSGAALHH
jgi:tripartite-type tricarboxylate transporter receptor subunit TctC